MLPIASAEVATQNMPREAMYKNKGMTSVEMRKRRETDIAQLRKQKRDDEINKRRNIKENNDMFIGDEDDSMCESPNIFDEKILSNLFSDRLSAQESAMRLFRRRFCFGKHKGNCLIDEAIALGLIDRFLLILTNSTSICIRRDAASILGSIVADKGNCLIDEAIALGLIDRFLLILTNSTSICIRRDAASILGSIVAGTSTHTECVVRSGAVPTFIHLLSEDDEEIREHSLLAIGNIAADQCSYRDLCLSLDVIPAILRILNSSTKPSEIRSAVWTISNLCRGKNPPPDFSRVSIALPALSKQLFNQDAATLADACRAVASLSEGENSHIEVVVQSGVVRRLVELLLHPNPTVSANALRAIGNIVTGTDQQTQGWIISFIYFLFLISSLLASTKPSEIRSAVWTISNLCRGKNPPPDFSRLQVSIALPALSKQLFNQDAATLADACRAVASLSEGENSHIEVVVQSGVVRRLVELLLHPNPTVSANALRAIGNIVTGTDQQTQGSIISFIYFLFLITSLLAGFVSLLNSILVVLSCSALECLEKLLVTGKESIKKEVCWTLSNILAGNRKQIQTVIDAHILPSLIHVLASGDFKTRKEACWAIGNALSGGNASQVAAVVREGAILPLCDLLTVMEPKIVSVVLNALDSILRHGENIRSKSKTGINPYCALVEEARGLEKLEFLQQSPNLEIYVKAFDIIENYFAADEEVLTVNETNDEIQPLTTFDL
uniref:IBB domain-containing protein n=1 Tax=Ascaris lumbricoides TaxID=6252 RepID=A0A0M3IBT4_ASCLU